MNPVLKKDLIGLLRLKRIAAIQVLFVAMIGLMVLLTWPQGGVLAAPIWREFMVEALKGRPVLQFPPASGPRMNFPASEGGNANALAAGGGSTSAKKPSGPRAPVSVHGGVDNKLGGLY